MVVVRGEGMWNMSESMLAGKSIALQINGEEFVWSGDPTKPLADVIREDCGWTGTKIGCRTGECGACTVLVDGRPVVSCLIPVASVADREVQTIESLAQDEEFQKLVQAMADEGGVQCGFCTPGIMVSLWAWLQQRQLFPEGVSAALKNNLCRCTGYRSILSAAERVAAEREGVQ